MQERILEMSRRYEGLQREADASAEALLRTQADVRRLEGDCAEVGRQLTGAQTDAARLNAALQTTKVCRSKKLQLQCDILCALQKHSNATADA